MLYKFKSKAAGDLIMLAPNGDSLLRLAGRAPAPQGIFEVGQMAAIRQAIEAAVQQDDAMRAQAKAAEKAAADNEAAALPALSLRIRLWPMVEMLKRCEAAGQPIVWGV